MTLKGIKTCSTAQSYSTCNSVFSIRRKAVKFTACTHHVHKDTNRYLTMVCRIT